MNATRERQAGPQMWEISVQIGLRYHFNANEVSDRWHAPSMDHPWNCPREVGRSIDASLAFIHYLLTIHPWAGSLDFMGSRKLFKALAARFKPDSAPRSLPLGTPGTPQLSRCKPANPAKNTRQAKQGAMTTERAIAVTELCHGHGHGHNPSPPQ